MPDIEKIATNGERVIIKDRHLEVTPHPDLGGDPCWADLVATGHVPDGFEVVCELLGPKDVSRNLVLRHVGSGNRYVVQGFGFVSMEDGKMVATPPDTSMNLNEYLAQLDRRPMGTTVYDSRGLPEEKINNVPLGGIVYESLKHKIENTLVATKAIRDIAVTPTWIASGFYNDIIWRDGKNLGWGVYTIPDFWTIKDVIRMLSTDEITHETYDLAVYRAAEALATMNKNYIVHAQPHPGNVGGLVDNGCNTAVISDFDTSYCVRNYRRWVRKGELAGMTSVEIVNAPMQTTFAQDLFVFMFRIAEELVNEYPIDYREIESFLSPAIAGYMSQFIDPNKIDFFSIKSQISTADLVEGAFPVGCKCTDLSSLKNIINLVANGVIMSLLPFSQDLPYSLNDALVLRKTGVGHLPGYNNFVVYFWRKLLPFFKRKPIVTDTSPQISRNDPCPCGSGKKFKQCCGKH